VRGKELKEREDVESIKKQISSFPIGLELKLDRFRTHSSSWENRVTLYGFTKFIKDLQV
jgi:hypothetical protein